MRVFDENVLISELDAITIIMPLVINGEKKEDIGDDQIDLFCARSNIFKFP